MPDDAPTNTPAAVESTFTRALLAGAVAGTTVDLTLFPIDTLKTRLQASAGFTRSGGFKGIYKGVGSAFVGSAPGAGLFFVTYEKCKASMRRWRLADGDRGARSGRWGEPIEHMVAASLGEVAACAVRVPTEVVKQRAQALQHPSSLAALQGILAQSRTRGLRHVWLELYRGWAITVLREVPFTMIQFPLWEAMKAWRRRETGLEMVSGLESAGFGSVAGAAAAAFTTPLDVLKTRMMLATEREGAWSMLRQILKHSGPMAFFAGIGPRIVWISAGGAIFLGSYQWAFNALHRLG